MLKLLMRAVITKSKSRHVRGSSDGSDGEVIGKLGGVLGLRSSGSANREEEDKGGFSWVRSEALVSDLRSDEAKRISSFTDSIPKER